MHMPHACWGGGSSPEPVSKVKRSREEVHRDQKRPVLLRSVTHGPCRGRRGTIPVSGKDAALQPSGFRGAVCELVVLPEVIYFASLCCLELLRKSLAQEGPDARHLRARWDASRMVGDDLVVQMPHAMGIGRLIEEGRKVGEPLRTASHNQRAVLPTEDAHIELRRTNDSLESCSNLNQERSSLAVTAEPD